MATEKRRIPIIGHLAIAIPILLVVGGISVLYVTQKDLNERVIQASIENADLKMQVANLSLMVGENGHLLTLEKELIAISKGLKASGKTDLGIDLPNVAHKVLELSERYKDDGVTTSLILALIEVESSFDPRATSNYTDEAGKTRPLAYGLTQMVRSTATHYLTDMGYSWNPDILYDPVLSVEIGVRHLVDLHRQYVSEGLEFKNEFQWSILSYMWGERPVKESMSKKPNDRGYMSLNYWTRVREAQLRWIQKGF